ncbi:MAG: DUF624 domain-containing protein [Turicibacter sp.]|nr:DUF624 domain-containing protein [Turicibacter sp.]
MNGLFSLDSPLTKFLSSVSDVIILGVIWLLFSLPFFTIGASTTALFYVATRRISDKEGYLFRDFYSSFKANFKRATLLWLLWLVLLIVIGVNIFMLMYNEFDSTMVIFLLPLQICVFVELYFMSLYLFPLTARFDMTFLQTIKTSFFMANRHIPSTIACVLITLAILAFAYLFFPPMFLIGMGIYAYATSYLFMRIFRKYRPEIDEPDVVPNI